MKLKENIKTGNLLLKLQDYLKRIKKLGGDENHNFFYALDDNGDFMVANFTFEDSKPSYKRDKYFLGTNGDCYDEVICANVCID